MALIPVDDDEKKKPSPGNLRRIQGRGPQANGNGDGTLPDDIDFAAKFQQVPEFDTVTQQELPDEPERRDFLGKNENRALQALRFGGLAATVGGLALGAPGVAYLGSQIGQGAALNRQQQINQFRRAGRVYQETLPDVLQANMEARNRQLELQHERNMAQAEAEVAEDMARLESGLTRQERAQEGEQTRRTAELESDLEREETRVQGTQERQNITARGRQRRQTDRQQAQLQTPLEEARTAQTRRETELMGRDEETGGMTVAQARREVPRLNRQIESIEQQLESGTKRVWNEEQSLEETVPLTVEDEQDLRNELQNLYDRRNELQRRLDDARQEFGGREGGGPITASPDQAVQNLEDRQPQAGQPGGRRQRPQQQGTTTRFDQLDEEQKQQASNLETILQGVAAGNISVQVALRRVQAALENGVITQEEAQFLSQQIRTQGGTSR